MMIIQNILWIALFLMLLLALHELGHILTAKALHLRISKIGFTLKPFPHVFVKIEWPRKKNQRTLFLMSGFLAILCLIVLVLLLGVSFKPLLIALCLQIIIETNPIYSDFVIINIVDKVAGEVRKTRKPYTKVYNSIYTQYLFSAKWHLHFLVWVIIVITVLNVIKNLWI